MNGRVFLSRPERGKNTKMCQVVFDELNRGRRWTTEARLRGGGRVGPDLERERERERDLSRIDTEKLSSFHSELVETNKRPFHAKELFKWKWIAERETEIFFFVTLKNLCSDHIRILDTKFSHFFGPEFFFQPILSTDHWPPPDPNFFNMNGDRKWFFLLQSWKLFIAEPNSCRTKNKWGADWSQAFKIFTVHVLPRSWLSEAKLGSLHYLSELRSCNLILGAASFDPSDFCAREPNGISSTSRQGLNKLKWAWTLDSIWPITNPNLRSPRFESRQIQWRSKLSNYQL